MESIYSETISKPVKTYALLNAIREESPSSIREIACLVDRNKKKVHEELTTLEALGRIRVQDRTRVPRTEFSRKQPDRIGRDREYRYRPVERYDLVFSGEWNPWPVRETQQ